MYNQQQPAPEDEEQEDAYYQGVSSVNHRGKSAIYVVAYFALLAILMYPAHKLHLGTQGVFFAMLAAGLGLSLCVLAAKWARRKLAALQLSKKGFIQLMVGYRPDDAAGSVPEPEATTGAQPSPATTSTSLVPLPPQRTVRYGEVVGFDEDEGELPEHLIEENPLYLSESFQPDVNSLLGATALLCGMRRSGKQGLGLILATQRIAELDKRALQSQWKFLFRQTELIDIGLYTRMGLERDEVTSLRQGECFIFSPSVIGFRAMLRARYSPHLAHTPGLSELASHLRQVRPLEVVTRHYASIEASAAGPDASQRQEYRQEAGTTAPAPLRSKPQTELERVLAVYQENPLASYRELGEKLGMGKDKVGDLLKELRERGMIEQS